MAAYLIGKSTVTNPALMEEYVNKAGPTLAGTDAKLLVSGECEIAHMDGDWKPDRLVIIEFPSMAAAKEWYHSPAYQEIAHMRLEASEGGLVFVEGVD